MAFMIKDKDGKGISINELDREAAAFWGVEFSEKQYACPPKGDTNWFDMIGLYIHAQRPRKSELKEVQTEWDEVLGLMMGYLLLTANSDGVKASIDRYWDEYISLIRHWKGLGYTAWAIAD